MVLDDKKSTQYAHDWLLWDDLLISLCSIDAQRGVVCFVSSILLHLRFIVDGFRRSRRVNAQFVLLCSLCLVLLLLALYRGAMRCSRWPGACWNYLAVDRLVVALQGTLHGNKSGLDPVVPKYFLEEELVDEERLQLLEHMFAEKQWELKMPTLSGTPSKYHLVHSVSSGLRLTAPQSVAILCRIERARSAMQRAKVLERLCSDHSSERVGDEHAAATTFQSAFKGDRVRRGLVEQTADELLFLEMAAPKRLRDRGASSAGVHRVDSVDWTIGHDLDLFADFVLRMSNDQDAAKSTLTLMALSGPRFVF